METKAKKTVKSNAKFDYKTIKTFEDACNKLKVDFTNLSDFLSLPERFRKFIIAGYKLVIIYEAINNGWVPDWNNYSQKKYYPWYGVLSSGFGFSVSVYLFDYAGTSVGSRLCTDTSEKALYIGKQFEAEYQEYLLYNK